MKKEQIVIFVLVGIMLFSSLGFGFLILAEGDGTSTTSHNAGDTVDLNQELEPLPEPDAFIVEGDVTELMIEDLVEGEGDPVQAGDTIVVHYHGTIAQDGVVFDSSYRRGEPIAFPLTGLIEGWQEGIPGMKPGGKRRLIIPSEKAYGEVGVPPAIGPNTDLVFEIELIGVE